MMAAFPRLRVFGDRGASGGDSRIGDRLRPDAVLLRYPDGAAYRWKHVTAFSALSDLIAGRTDALRAYAAWTREAGGNGWRVFGGWSRLSLDYRRAPTYFGSLDALCRLTRDEDLRLQFVAICDYIPADTAEAQGFVRRCADVLAPYPHTFLSLANEPYKNLTGGDDAAAAWPVPRGPLFDRGAAAIDSPDRFTPLPNGASISVAHLSRGGEWFRKGKDLYEIRESYPGTRGPVVNDEPTRVGIDGANPAQWFWYGVTNAMFGEGATAHGDADTLQLCRRPPAAEDAAVRAFFAGMDLVPLEAPTWRYGRYGEGNPGTPHVVADVASAIRVYEMSSDRQAIAVAVGATRPLQAVNGWRIVTASADGTAAVLER